MNATMRSDVDGFMRDFERWVPGPAERRREARRELEAHLAEAREMGQLEHALSRLGTPRDAARTFTGHRLPPVASRTRRVVGYLLDLAILLGPISIMNRMVRELTDPWFTAQFALALIAAAFFWFTVGLILVEWRYGRTPGKLIAGTRVVSEDGTAIDLGQAAIRRLPLIFSGPLQIVDWAFALFGPRHQRGFDRLARTVVVRAGAGTTTS